MVIFISGRVLSSFHFFIYYYDYILFHLSVFVMSLTICFCCRGSRILVVLQELTSGVFANKAMANHPLVGGRSSMQTGILSLPFFTLVEYKALVEHRHVLPGRVGCRGWQLLGDQAAGCQPEATQLNMAAEGWSHLCGKRVVSSCACPLCNEILEHLDHKSSKQNALILLHEGSTI